MHATIKDTDKLKKIRRMLEENPSPVQIVPLISDLQTVILEIGRFENPKFHVECKVILSHLRNLAAAIELQSKNKWSANRREL